MFATVKQNIDGSYGLKHWILMGFMVCFAYLHTSWHLKRKMKIARLKSHSIYDIKPLPHRDAF